MRKKASPLFFLFFGVDFSAFAFENPRRTHVPHGGVWGHGLARPASLRTAPQSRSAYQSCSFVRHSRGRSSFHVRAPNTRRALSICAEVFYDVKIRSGMRPQSSSTAFPSSILSVLETTQVIGQCASSIRRTHMKRRPTPRVAYERAGLIGGATLRCRPAASSRLRKA